MYCWYRIEDIKLPKHGGANGTQGIEISEKCIRLRQRITTDNYRTCCGKFLRSLLPYGDYAPPAL